MRSLAGPENFNPAAETVTDRVKRRRRLPEFPLRDEPLQLADIAGDLLIELRGLLRGRVSHLGLTRAERLDFGETLLKGFSYLFSGNLSETDLPDRADTRAVLDRSAPVETREEPIATAATPASHAATIG